MPAAGQERLFTEYLSRDGLPAYKKTKKGEKELDIKPLVLRWEIVKPGAVSGIFTGRSPGEEAPALHVLLKAGSTDNLKPTLLMAGIALNAQGSIATETVPAREPEGLNADVLVHRVDLYMEADSQENGHRIVPMIATDRTGWRIWREG